MSGLLARGGGVIGGRLVCRRRGLSPWWRRDQLTRPRQRGGLGAASGEQAVVTDAMKAFGQHVQHEAPDELARGERHGVVAAGSFNPIVLVPERNAVLVDADQPAAG